MSSLPAVEAPKVQLPDAAAKKREEVKQVAQQFEAVFLGEMTKIMLNSVPEDDVFGGGNAESIYKGMLSEQLGASIAQKGGIGLSTNIMNEIIKMQGGK